MSKNQFTPLQELPDEDTMKNLVDNLQYKRIQIRDVPFPISDNGLIQKCNSVLLAASGSTDGTLYSLVGIRKDKESIDEHPVVLYFSNTDPSKNFGGIIHHGDWPDRTIPLEEWQLNAMAASGLTASFTYKSIPMDGSGSLYDLKENGMLSGISAQFNLLNKKRP
jgi:hypothetical protein